MCTSVPWLSFQGTPRLSYSHTGKTEWTSRVSWSKQDSCSHSPNSCSFLFCSARSKQSVEMNSLFYTDKNACPIVTGWFSLLTISTFLVLKTWRLGLGYNVTTQSKYRGFELLHMWEISHVRVQWCIRQDGGILNSVHVSVTESCWHCVHSNSLVQWMTRSQSTDWL